MCVCVCVCVYLSLCREIYSKEVVDMMRSLTALNLQDRLDSWKPREELIFQFKSGGSLLAKFCLLPERVGLLPLRALPG